MFKTDVFNTTTIIKQQQQNDDDDKKWIAQLLSVKYHPIKSIEKG